MALQYADIVLLAQELLGEIAEGSSTYSPAQYQAAIQWAQEQFCTLTGASYLEKDGIAVNAITGPWGETMHEVDIPTDAIKVTRVEFGQNITPPVPYYTITVTPPLGDVMFDESGNQVNAPTVFVVQIQRYNGHTAPIQITFPGDASIFSTGTFSATMDGGGMVLANAPDTFNILASGDETDWNSVIAGWTNVQLQGLDSNSLAELSNQFSAVDPEPNLQVSVDPSTINWSETTPDAIFDVTVTRLNGYSGDVSAQLVMPRPLLLTARIDTQTQTGGVIQFTIMGEDNAPDTFEVEVTYDPVVVEPLPWAVVMVIDTSGNYYTSNSFKIQRAT